MKFTPINWPIYNKPPYFPQWLSRGETKKLVSYDDGLLADIDRHIGRLSDQYDLDTITGVLLDLRGKLLKENRNGNPDEVYRMFLKLRTMLNTADGTVNDIIKIIKFVYSARQVRIVPDYPAGLVIEYNGMKQDYLDYNSILAEVIAAGVGYHTRALFDFVEDKIAIDDRIVITVLADFVERMEAHDSFSLRLSDLNFTDHVYGRSTIVYGGVQGGARYNGVHKHNGMITFQREMSRYKHDGEIVFGSGLSDRFAADEFSLGVALDFTDTVPSRDELSITLTRDQSDRFPSSQIYNGTMTHNGQYKWNAPHDVVTATQHREELLDSVSIGDEPVEAELLAALSDTETITDSIGAIMDVAVEDEVDMDDVLALSVNTDISDFVDIDDSFVIGIIGYRVYGGSDDSPFAHDGSIKFNYGELSYV